MANLGIGFAPWHCASRSVTNPTLRSHAACDVFATRTASSRNAVEIRTLDRLISQIASAHHTPLDPPADVSVWSRTNEDGHNRVAVKLAHLLARKPMIAGALARRYPLIIYDEHQDATAAQDQIILVLHKAGVHLRVFGAPMQRIFGGRNAAAIDAPRSSDGWTSKSERMRSRSWTRRTAGPTPTRR